MTYLHHLHRSNPEIVCAELKAAADRARNGGRAAMCNFAAAELECFVRADGSAGLSVAMRRSNGRGIKAAEVQTVVECLGTTELAGCEMAPGKHTHDLWLVVRVSGPTEPKEASA